MISNNTSSRKVQEIAEDVKKRHPSIDFIRAAPVLRPGRWLGMVILSLMTVWLLVGIAGNENFRWDVVWLYLRDVKVIQGLGWTLVLTFASMLLAFLLALLLTFMRESQNWLFRGVSWFWVWFFRGTPVYTQLIFWGLFATLYPKLVVGIPWGPALWSWNTQDVVNFFVASILGLGLNESAYLAEIFRAGFKSVDRGQTEAAEALGMRRSAILRRIVLPQAMRVIVPPTGNETISMLKTTSLVVAVPFLFGELTFATTALANKTYLPIPFLIIAAFWYIVITSIMMIGQYAIERHYGRGVDHLSPAPVKPQT